MFRYIAIAWNPAEPFCAAQGHQLGLQWQQRTDWVLSLHHPGLQVFTTGVQLNVNQPTPLPEQLGIVIGKLFRRHVIDPTALNPTQFSSGEAAQLLRTSGQSLVSDFWGRYVAFLRHSSGTTCVLRDPSGTLPCFRLRHAGVTLVFSWLEDALLMLGGEFDARINWDALCAQLLTGALIGRETALMGVTQVLPGEIVDLQDDEPRPPALLWNAVEIANSPAALDAQEATQLIRQTVQSCTRAWASCYTTLLLRLSGGLDSSILLGCMAPADTSADVICLNYHSRGSDSDERYFARLSAARAGRDLLERERNPSFQLERVLQIARMPDPVPYIGWMNANTDAQLARAYGAGALFTGAGGDALFYEIPRWWPAADYLHTKGLTTGFAAAAMDAARLGRVSLWRAGALALRERIHLRTESRSPKGATTLLAQSFLQDREREAKHESRFIHPALQMGPYLPIGKYMQTVALMHPMGYYDPFEQAAAAELVNPLLSQPLVELCLRLPSYVLTQGGQGRALARRAFAPDLPPQITHRRSKGGMEEHIKSVLKANRDFARTLLLEGKLSHQGWIDRAKVEESLSGRPTALPGPISQIHGLVAIEAWLSRWSN
ncbi:asparagine synthase-related protein [Paucibacter sp. KBW04]|uniref:asparagine synthase-related protein n=1 Tax=Paucibacter sp. KBW04 TaxID=2153361 RepID=UPI0011CFBB09|nr:asparagine synthase-related protein [Paucibacter sp. KBW04]